MIDRESFARAEGAAFRIRLLEQIGDVVAGHCAAVVDYACEMQSRLDKAEGLLADILKTGREGLSVRQVRRIEKLIAQAKARTP